MAQAVKVCPTCKVEQPVENFAWRHKANGVRKSHCRECCKMMYRQYYHDNGGKNVHRKAYLLNRESRISYMKDYKRKDSQASRYDPMKGPAHIAVYRALKSGKITRPDRCEKCKSLCSPEAHHHNGYDKAHRLDVVWLCRQCHDLADHPEFANLKMEIEHNVSADHTNR